MASHTENSKVTSTSNFLSVLKYEIDKELEEGDWPEPEDDE